MKSIPKSLHTVSVLVNVARVYISHGNIPQAALGMAVKALGYQDAEDPQDLYSKALKQLAVTDMKKPVVPVIDEQQRTALNKLSSKVIGITPAITPAPRKPA